MFIVGLIFGSLVFVSSVPHLFAQGRSLGAQASAVPELLWVGWVCSSLELKRSFLILTRVLHFFLYR